MGRGLSLGEKLEIAFDIQDKNEFINLLESGAHPQHAYDLAKRMGSWRLSILQCDLLKEADKYK